MNIKNCDVDMLTKTHIYLKYRFLSFIYLLFSITKVSQISISLLTICYHIAGIKIKIIRPFSHSLSS